MRVIIFNESEEQVKDLFLMTYLNVSFTSSSDKGNKRSISMRKFMIKQICLHKKELREGIRPTW